MKFLDFFLPTKKVVYQTSLSPQKVIQRIESKISPEPKKKSMFEVIPLSYHGKIKGNKFEFGRRSIGHKDRPPTAQGVIEENPANPIETFVRVTIIPNPILKRGVIFFLILVSLVSLPAIFSLLNNNSDSIGIFIFLPIFFSFGFFINYLFFVSYNHKLAKDIERFIDGKVTK